MIFYLGVVGIVGLLIHSIIVAVQKRETILPDGSKLYSLEFMSTDVETKINKGYSAVTGTVMIAFFGLVSAFIGSMLGMYLFISM